MILNLYLDNTKPTVQHLSDLSDLSKSLKISNLCSLKFNLFPKFLKVFQLKFKFIVIKRWYSINQNFALF